MSNNGLSSLFGSNSHDKLVLWLSIGCFLTALIVITVFIVICCITWKRKCLCCWFGCPKKGKDLLSRDFDTGWYSHTVSPRYNHTESHQTITDTNSKTFAILTNIVVDNDEHNTNLELDD